MCAIPPDDDDDRVLLDMIETKVFERSRARASWSESVESILAMAGDNHEPDARLVVVLRQAMQSMAGVCDEYERLSGEIACLRRAQSHVCRSRPLDRPTPVRTIAGG